MSLMMSLWGAKDEFERRVTIWVLMGVLWMYGLAFTPWPTLLELVSEMKRWWFLVFCKWILVRFPDHAAEYALWRKMRPTMHGREPLQRPERCPWRHGRTNQ
jgi:hypothetical protein